MKNKDDGKYGKEKGFPVKRFTKYMTYSLYTNSIYVIDKIS